MSYLSYHVIADNHNQEILIYEKMTIFCSFLGKDIIPISVFQKILHFRTDPKKILGRGLKRRLIQ